MRGFFAAGAAISAILMLLWYTRERRCFPLSKRIKTLTAAAVLLAVGMVLPFITGQIQAIAKIISPLHIPALICGLVCGWKLGLAVGVVLPILRGLTFGLPPFPTTALPMAFELGAYGLLTGLCYPLLVRLLRRKSHLPALLAALLIAMVGGRGVGGAARALLLQQGLIGSAEPYTFAVFFASYFAGTAPGALIHLVLIPAVVTALEKARLSPLFS